MGNNLNEKNNSEEINLIQLFGFFEGKVLSVFNKLFNFFKSIFKLFMSVVKDVFLNLKIILSLLTLAIIAGVVIDMTKDKVYYSEMFVSPKFDSKYELIGNIDYYNSLIKLKDFDELSKRFELNIEEAKSLLEFEIEIGPESKNEQIIKFNSFLKEVDSTTKSKIIFKDFLEDRNIYHAGMYLIRARSTEYKVFKKLNEGLNNSVEKTFSSIKQKENDALLSLEEVNLKESLKEIQKLKATYLEVLEKEAEKTNVSSSIGSTLGFQVEKTETKEDKLLDKELEVLNKLNNIKKERILNNAIFENYSTFKEKGLLENTWYKKFKIVLPLLMLGLLFLFNVSRKFYTYALNFKQ